MQHLSLLLEAVCKVTYKYDCTSLTDDIVENKISLAE